MVTHPQDWYPEEDQAELCRLTGLVTAKGAVVEVGCWTGQSTQIIHDHLGSVLCVDPWGDTAYADRADPAAILAYTQFIENTHRLPITRFRCGWADFFRIFDGPLAFLHIDAVHEYEHVKGNLEAALPYIQPGTILCGHDYVDWFPGVAQAVDEVLGTVHVAGRVWSWPI